MHGPAQVGFDDPARGDGAPRLRNSRKLLSRARKLRRHGRAVTRTYNGQARWVATHPSTYAAKRHAPVRPCRAREARRLPHTLRATGRMEDPEPVQVPLHGNQRRVREGPWVVFASAGTTVLAPGSGSTARKGCQCRSLKVLP